MRVFLTASSCFSRLALAHDDTFVSRVEHYVYAGRMAATALNDIAHVTVITRVVLPQEVVVASLTPWSREERCPPPPPSKSGHMGNPGNLKLRRVVKHTTRQIVRCQEQEAASQVDWAIQDTGSSRRGCLPAEVASSPAVAWGVPCVGEMRERGGVQENGTGQ
jgi:hypothetical protein